MLTNRVGRSLSKLARNEIKIKGINYSSIGKPTWPSGKYPPPGSVPPPQLYPNAKEEEKCEFPPQCCPIPGCVPPCCPPVSGDQPCLDKDCRGRRRICPPPCCYPGQVPCNPCCPQFPNAHFRTYKRLFYFCFLPLIIIAALNAFFNEHCPKGPCREFEYMRRRTKRFPWGDGNTTFFHNECVNHLPQECEPPPLICYPDIDCDDN